MYTRKEIPKPDPGIIAAVDEIWCDRCGADAVRRPGPMHEPGLIACCQIQTIRKPNSSSNWPDRGWDAQLCQRCSDELRAWIGIPDYVDRPRSDLSSQPEAEAADVPHRPTKKLDPPDVVPRTWLDRERQVNAELSERLRKTEARRRRPRVK